MHKKFKKICAIVLSTVTMLSVLPASGLVSAETNTDTSTETTSQSTVYLKVPNPSGQVVVTSNPDTDEELVKTITVDDEKTTLTDNDGNISDVELTEDGYCLELTEKVGKVIDIEIIASENYEVGTYRILTDSGDEVENVTLSDGNKYEYTFTDEDQVLEITFKKTENTTEENVNNNTSNDESEDKLVEGTQLNQQEENQDTESTEGTYNSEDIVNKIKETDKFIEDNFDLSQSPNALLGIAPLYVGETVYTKGFSSELGERGQIDIIRYNDPVYWQDYDVLKNWSEGVLGASTGEWMFCADPNQHFRAGNKTSVNASNYYSQDTITLIAGLLYYVDHNSCSGLTDVNKYYIKQCFVWRVLNEVNHWYTGGDRIAFEYGNGTQDSQGHWIADHYSDLYWGGTEWVNANRSSLQCTGEIFQGSGQPLSRWSCTYNPTGSGYIVILRRQGRQSIFVLNSVLKQK